MEKINGYIDFLYETQLLSEEVGIDLPTVNKGMVMRINKVIDLKQPSKTISAINKLTPAPFKGPKAILKVDSYLANKSDDFKEFKVTATKVVRNSLPEVSPKMVAASGLYLAAVSTMFTKKGDQNKPTKQILKNNIKDFISKCRKFGEDYDDEDEESKKKPRTSDVADLAVAMVIITSAAATAAGLLGGFIMIAKAISLFITGWVPPLAIGLIILLAFVFGLSWLAKGAA